MNSYFVGVMVEFSRSGKRVRLDVPIRQIFYLDRDSEREVNPDGSVIYRLPRKSGLERFEHNSFTECPCAA